MRVVCVLEAVDPGFEFVRDGAQDVGELAAPNRDRRRDDPLPVPAAERVAEPVLIRAEHERAARVETRLGRMGRRRQVCAVLVAEPVDSSRGTSGSSSAVTSRTTLHRCRSSVPATVCELLIRPEVLDVRFIELEFDDTSVAWQPDLCTTDSG